MFNNIFVKTIIMVLIIGIIVGIFVRLNYYENMDINMVSLENNKYGKYIVPTHHNRPVTESLKNGDVWEENTINFILNNHNNLPIITAGTYIGDFLPAFRKIPVVYAFEPVPENYKYALLNKILNDLDNVNLENLCLSDNNGKLRMVTSRNDIALGGGSMVTSKVDNDNVEVASVKLDDYFRKDKPNIGIIHLDVENHETEVLDGSMETIERCKPIIIVETKPDVRVENLLEKLGYKYYDKELDANKILYIESNHKLNML